MITFLIYFIIQGLALFLIGLCLFFLYRRFLVFEKKSVDFEFIFDRFEKRLTQDFQSIRETFLNEFQRNRQDALSVSKGFHETVDQRLHDMMTLQQKQLDGLRQTFDQQFTTLQKDNHQKLEQMRQTVDEKLNVTLEKRLGQSFKMVGDQLEQVYKGLGEMRHLAQGVGDLKKVLSNVKTRGTWGEIQLGALLEQVLAPEQYAHHVRVMKDRLESVEYAIKLPGKHDERQVWLPIDSKFPMDVYQRIVLEQEEGDADRLAAAYKQLEFVLKREAKSISNKYIAPPYTTDFAIMFLPIEGLYADVIRCTELVAYIQQTYRVIVSGPSTLAALLNSLQMGFRTLAIEKRSSEVWALLSGVKSEFSKFTLLLDKTQKKLQEAGNTIEDASRKSRTIQRKLGKVEDVSEDSLLTTVDSDVLLQGSVAKYPI